MRVGCLLISLLCTLLSMKVSSAAEGMWALDNLPTAELQSHYKFKPTKAWVNKVMHASVRLAQGCSGSFVSPNGLVLTNHHCASRCIEQLSTPESNYIRTGFIARTRSAEPKCPELELNQLEQISDITDKIKASTKGKEGDAFKAALNAAMAKQTAACMANKNRAATRCDVVELYNGGRYQLYRYHRYQDVRLVWAPELAAAFFGGDSDNFNFPRYDIDAAIVRAYENGKPASNSDYFRIKAAGAEADELTIVSGHPGSTQRELTVSQLETLRDKRILRTLLLYAELRGVLEQYQKSGAEPARIAAGDLFSIENTLKAFHGELIALQRPGLLEQKRSAEQTLQQYVAAHPELPAADAWQSIAGAEQAYGVIGDEHYFIETGRGFMSKYYMFARALVRGAVERSKPDAERLPEYSDAALPQLEQSLFSTAPIYPDYEKIRLAWSLTKMREWLGADHPLVRKVLGKETPEQLATRLVAGTMLKDPATRRALWDKPQMVAQFDDPFIQLALAIDDDARAIRRRYDSEVEGIEQRAGQAIAEARFAMTGTGAYPDATFTLRLSFGEVKGWQEGEQEVAPFTDFAGAFQRHTGAEPFALPTSWLLVKNSLKGETRLDFVTTNDIVGGNSGSPVINRNAELVGLIFDGNIHSLGGAFGYDESLNRAVAVHPAALLESLRTIYSAPELLKELNAR
jgi:hypothetical protein